MHKMPYKHIAAHLQKTELACRLHYHQLSFGTKRRRRTLSASSTKSGFQPDAIHESNETPQRIPPTFSPPDSPEDIHSESTRPSSAYNPISILPKPVIGSQRVTQQNLSLHLITQDIERFEERSRVDKARLDKIYEAHRCHFWSMVARDYGDNVSPAVLEDVWRRTAQAPMSQFPPTPPNRSPQSDKGTPAVLGSAFGSPEQSNTNTFRPINLTRSSYSTSSVPTRSSFAISSLLTEDKEVRSPSAAGNEKCVR